MGEVASQEDLTWSVVAEGGNAAVEPRARALAGAGFLAELVHQIIEELELLEMA
jgi:hypothetical protein